MIIIIATTTIIIIFKMPLLVSAFILVARNSI